MADPKSKPVDPAETLESALEVVRRHPAIAAAQRLVELSFVDATGKIIVPGVDFRLLVRELKKLFPG